MKNLIKICTLLALVIIPMSAIAQEPTDAQSKHSIKTKGAGTNNDVKLFSCTPPKNPNGQPDPTEHAIQTKGAGGVGRTMPGGQDSTSESSRIGEPRKIKLPPVAPPRWRIVEGTCEPVIAVAPNQPFTFDWSLGASQPSSRSVGSPSISERFSGPLTYHLIVWEVIQNNKNPDLMRSPEPLIDKSGITDDHFTVNRISILHGLDNLSSIVWEVQAISSTGKTVAVNKGGMGWDLAVMKK